VTVVLILPAWTSRPYWAMLREGPDFVRQVESWMVWEPRFREMEKEKALFQTGLGVRIWAGLYRTGG